MANITVPNDNTWNAPVNNPSAVYEASRVVKASAGILFGITIHNSNVAAQFIQLHDSAALPANGAAPVTLITIPAASSINLDFGAHGKAFALGIVVCNSTTGPTKTLGAADCFFDARFK